MGRAGALAASALAPTGSAIGLLAGPLGAIRAIAGPEPNGRGRRAATAASALAGTVLYLAALVPIHYRDVLAESVDRNFEPRAAVFDACRAPFDALLPALVGRHDAGGRLGEANAAALAVAGVLGLLAWARRSRDDRHLSSAASG